MTKLQEKTKNRVFSIDSTKLIFNVLDVKNIKPQNGETVGDIIQRYNRTTGEIPSEKSSIDLKRFATLEIYETKIGYGFTKPYWITDPDKPDRKIEYFKVNPMEEPQKLFKEFYIHINSKVLTNDYLKGIQWNTIDKIYDFINENIAEISREALLKCIIEDLDIKRDQKINHIKNAIGLLSQEPHKFEMQAFQRENNLGIQWSNRKGTKGKPDPTPANPYIKFYSKLLDSLKDEMLPFTEKYLNRSDLENLLRCEANFLNNKFFKYYKLPNTLEEILNIEDEIWCSIFEQYFEKHLYFNIKKLKDMEQEELSANDIAILKLLQLNIESQKFGYTELKNLILEETPKTRKGKNMRYQLKKTLDHLYYNFIVKTEAGELNEDMRKLQNIFFPSYEKW